MKPTLLMQQAYLVSQESKCVSWKVGAIVAKDGRVITTGVNGSPSRGVNCCDHAHKQGWMTTEGYKNKKYLMRSFGVNDVFYESDEIPKNNRYWEIPEGAKVAFKRGFNPDFNIIFYKDVEGLAYVWSNDYKHTGKFEHENPEYGWYESGAFFSNIVDKGFPIWKSKNIGPHNRAAYLLDPKHREDHSEWSRVNEIHAEMNALLFASKHGLSVNGATMYVTLSPCCECAKAIAQSGIKTLVYCETYDKNVDGWDAILKQNGVEVHQIPKHTLTYLNWENVKNFGGVN